MLELFRTTGEEYDIKNMGYEVFEPVVKKSHMSRDIVQFSPLKVNVSEEDIASIFRVEE
jgi:hypothetical protein